jgi:anaerobic selenocysteine-containing dehydrogenase
VLLDEANPVHGSPSASKVREALEKAPYVVSVGSFIDDTSALADLILPDHSFLESWVDAAPESGAMEEVTTTAGPVMKPIHDTRATADVIIDVAGKLKSPVALPWKSAEEVAKAPLPQGAPASPAARETATFADAQFDGDATQFPFHLLPFKTPQFGDGSTAHLPWLQELPDPITSAMWSSWIEINPSTAARLQIAQGDLVDVTSAHGALRVSAMIVPTIAPDVVGIPVGQGHNTFTRYASGRGVNPLAILAPLTEKTTGALAWAATRVKVARAGDNDGRLVMFAGESREHPHEGQTR